MLPPRRDEPLLEADVASDPISQFDAWFRDAREVATGFPETMTLATAAKSGAPSARTLLLKGFDGRGFVFFSNYESRKGRELAENPQAALVFYWHELGRQVRVEGRVAKISAAESEAYFRTRPLESRLAAWASPQSEVITSRGALDVRFAEVRAEYDGGDPPLPPFWGGFLLTPETFEFWQHRENRLHDRLRYRRERDGWLIERLAP
jgi:pyridoxamine 5'-phosphate oxidase